MAHIWNFLLESTLYFLIFGEDRIDGIVIVIHLSSNARGGRLQHEARGRKEGRRVQTLITCREQFRRTTRWPSSHALLPELPYSTLQGTSCSHLLISAMSYLCYLSLRRFASVSSFRSSPSQTRRQFRHFSSTVKRADEIPKPDIMAVIKELQETKLFKEIQQNEELMVSIQEAVQVLQEEGVLGSSSL